MNYLSLETKTPFQRIHKNVSTQLQWRVDGRHKNILHTCLPVCTTRALQRRHIGRDSVSNHQPHDCFINRLFRHRSKKTSKLRVTGLCAGNSQEAGEFPAQMASNAENVSIWWRYHVYDNSLTKLDTFYFPWNKNANHCREYTKMYQTSNSFKLMTGTKILFTLDHLCEWHWYVNKRIKSDTFSFSWNKNTVSENAPKCTDPTTVSIFYQNKDILSVLSVYI